MTWGSASAETLPARSEFTQPRIRYKPWEAQPSRSPAITVLLTAWAWAGLKPLCNRIDSASSRASARDSRIIVSSLNRPSSLAHSTAPGLIALSLGDDDIGIAWRDTSADQINQLLTLCPGQHRANTGTGIFRHEAWVAGARDDARHRVMGQHKLQRQLRPAADLHLCRPTR